MIFDFSYDDLSLRLFNENDIELKIMWVNDPKNNQFLHYDLPLEKEKTQMWYRLIKHDKTRIDATILYQGDPVGIVGLLNIDRRNRKAEEYILIGETESKGKGIGTKAGNLLLHYAFERLHLLKVYAFIEIENEASIRLYERRGFVREGTLKNDLFYENSSVDRYLYASYPPLKVDANIMVSKKRI